MFVYAYCHGTIGGFRVVYVWATLVICFLHLGKRSWGCALLICSICREWFLCARSVL